jgi:hypothetical protein
MKKVQTALLLAGLGFLIYLLWKLGVIELWRQFKILGWGILPLILSEGLANLAHTVGWNHCLCGPRRTIRLSLLFKMALAGYAINFLTPSASVGGEVARGALLAGHQRGPEATSGVLIDKLSGAVAHLLLVVIGTVFVLWNVKLPRAIWIGLLLSNVLITAGIMAFLLLQKNGKLGGAIRWLAAHRPKSQTLQKMASDLTNVDELLKGFYQTRRAHLVLATAWHTIGHAVATFQTWLFLYLVNPASSLADVATASILCLWFDFATFAVPLNLGTLEGSRILALKAVGCSAVTGMTYGMAQRIAQIFWGVAGLLSYFSLLRGSAVTRASLPCDGLEAGPEKTGARATERPAACRKPDLGLGEHPLAN